MTDGDAARSNATADLRMAERDCDGAGGSRNDRGPTGPREPLSANDDVRRAIRIVGRAGVTRSGARPVWRLGRDLVRSGASYLSGRYV